MNATQTFYIPQRLFTGNNAKIMKTTKRLEVAGYDGVIAKVMHLSPAAEIETANGRRVNTCPFASEGCKAACLNTAGRGRMDFTQQARMNKTQYLFGDTPAFMLQLHQEIERDLRSPKKTGAMLMYRLNGTSDIPFWSPAYAYRVRYDGGRAVEVDMGHDDVEGFTAKMTVYEHFAAVDRVVFYDYTKSSSAYQHYVKGRMPKNYSLCFSRSEDESNQDKALAFLAAGGQVAVVFDKVPDSWNGYPVVDGDETDARPFDREVYGIAANTGFVVGLKAKGEAIKQQDNNFIVWIGQ